jgi:hypothetical protein
MVRSFATTCGQMRCSSWSASLVRTKSVDRREVTIAWHVGDTHQRQKRDRDTSHTKKTRTPETCLRNIHTLETRARHTCWTERGKGAGARLVDTARNAELREHRELPEKLRKGGWGTRKVK